MSFESNTTTVLLILLGVVIMLGVVGLYGLGDIATELTRIRILLEEQKKRVEK